MKITYGEYRLICSERCWQPKLVEQEKNSQLTVSTYALMWSNGNYYLVCRHRSMMNLRTDLSLHVELLPETFEPLKDFDPAQYQDRTPGMYPGKETYVLSLIHISEPTRRS